MRQLTQRTNRQLATIQKLKRQLAGSKTPLRDISNTASQPPQAAGEQAEAAEERADESTEMSIQLDSAERDEGVEGEGADESGQTHSAEASESQEGTVDVSDQDELDDSLPQRTEGQQQPTVAAEEDDDTDGPIACPPCSPIGRHKRSRTDDSEQCDTDDIDAHWKKARDDDYPAGEQEDDAAGHSEQQTAVVPLSTSPAAARTATHGLLPFKPSLLHPFPTSHTHLQIGSSGGGLTPYRGLLRPFSLAQQNGSPLRITQPVL